MSATLVMGPLAAAPEEKPKSPSPEALEAFRVAVWEAIKAGGSAPLAIARESAKLTDREAQWLFDRAASRIEADLTRRFVVPELRRKADELRRQAAAAVDPEDLPPSSFATMRQLRVALAVPPMAVSPQRLAAQSAASEAAREEERALVLLRSTSDKSLTREHGRLVELGGRLRGDIELRRKKIASLSPEAIEVARRYCDSVAAGEVVSPHPREYHQAVRSKLAKLMAERERIPEIQAEIAEKEQSLRNLAPKLAAVEAERLIPKNMDWTIT